MPQWFGLDWSGILINTAALAIIPFLFAAVGGALAAKVIQDDKARRWIVLCFWGLFAAGVLITLWQQVRSAESDLARDTSDTWMFIVASRSYAPPPAPDVASKVPPAPATPPEVAPYLHFGLDKSSILLNVVATSKTTAMAPQFNSVLWDLDADNPKNPLQIPAQSSPTSYVKRGDIAWGPFSLTSTDSEARVKTGHHIFGFLNVSCPQCVTRVYWVFAVMGKEGWYAEANKKDGLPSLDGLMRNFDLVRENPEGAWNQVIAHAKPKVKIADPQ